MALRTLWLALVGCGAPDAPVVDDRPSEPGVVVYPTDTPEPESDEVVEETIGPDTDVDTDLDEEPVAPAPSDWGAGLINISGPLAGPEFPWVDTGARSPARPPQLVGGVWVDLDHDGTDDLVVSTTPYEEGQVSAVLIFRWTPAGIERAPDLEAVFPTARGPWLSAYDLDGDGRRDLVSGDLRGSIYTLRDDGGFDLLWRAGTVPDLSWTGGAVPWDADHDGWLDLFVPRGNCAGALSLLIQVEPGRWARRDEGFGPGTVTGVGLQGVLPLTLPSGEELLVFALGGACGAVDPHPGFLVQRGATALGLPVWVPEDRLPMDAVWRYDPTVNMAPFTRVAPMGGGYQDLDGDGLPELAITLGYGSLALARGLADGSFEDVTFGHGLDFPCGGWGGPEVPWSLGFPDFDQDGRPDILVTMGDDATTFRWLDGFPVANRVYWNAGDLHFREVSADLGADLPGNWRGLGIGDPDRDGDADLFYGSTGSGPALLRNEIEVGHHGLSVGLRGTTSNPSGLGARLVVRADGLPDQHVVVGALANEIGHSDPLSFLGLGVATEAEVEVHWPSGVVQRVPGLAADAQHTLIEPELIEVEPASRRSRADGRSEVVVRVWPRATDGSVRAATVGVVVDGAGTVVDLAPDGLGWRAVVRAPSIAGSGRVIVTIDGVVAGIAPRLWWD